MTIAALYVETGGAYYGIPGVDPWDEKRDARNYAGPHPVVAHPPCARWCRLAGFVERRFGHKVGADGGCFASALAAVRTFGGVLEHPAYSKAWAAYGLPVPDRKGGWTAPDARGGHSCYVQQGRYGAPVKKATWLYAVRTDLPDLEWGYVHDETAGGLSWCGPLRKPNDPRDRQKGRKRFRATKATPPAFRAVLLALASSVTNPGCYVTLLRRYTPECYGATP